MEVGSNRPVASINQFVQGVRPVENGTQTTAARGAQATRTPAVSFGSLLDAAITRQREVRMSRHAEARLSQRGIALDEAQRERLSQAVDKAEEKGIRNSLVVVDDVALVVNVPNRTVVTAVTKGELRDNAFTNIDGAVFA